MIWTIKKATYRSIQSVVGKVTKLLKIPVPELLTGPGSVKKLPNVIKNMGISKILLVTDKGIRDIGLIEGLLEKLKTENIDCTVFDGVQPNPTIQNIEEGLQVYLANHCEGIIAFGGGSSMDCGKIIGARVSNPKKSVPKMRGNFKIPKKLPPLFAVPTTAGTGSECTVAAVITDSASHEKYAINSFKNIPLFAALDPELMQGLPPHITAGTGMDALTHAVEAYIGNIGTAFTDENAEKAVKIIFENLEAVYQDGSNLEQRDNMALASYYAGLAFTRAMVGYVHAIAHNMGGLYDVPHGLANAIILPYVLEYSRSDCEQKLARLAIVGGLGRDGEPSALLADRFIEKVKSMNQNMKIPTAISELQETDISLIAQRALKEANPNYPVPTLMNQIQCEALLRQLLPSGK